MGSFLMIVACEFITSLYASPSLSFCHMILIRWYEKTSLHLWSSTCFNPSTYKSLGMFAFTVPIKSRRWVSGSDCEKCEMPIVSKIVLAPSCSSSRLRVVQIGIQIGTSLCMFTSSRISSISSFCWSRSCLYVALEASLSPSLGEATGEPKRGDEDVQYPNLRDQYKMTMSVNPP